MTDLSAADLVRIRDAVPALDLTAIRALRRAGFDLAHVEPQAPVRGGAMTIPRPMRTRSLAALDTVD